ncbi:MAG TPA: cytochrome c biogenesis protein ResB [Tepidiformaceae bacterium]|nr:cytochrome c biogenesis protein ResB [Tepidiformaceae bacterium]
MAADARPRAAIPSSFDPFKFVWNLLTNVKFALVLVGTAAFAGLIGIVLPQVPGPMRGNAAAKSAWLELRRQDFGMFTTPMDRLGLFDVFHTFWFNGLWVVIIIAVTVCTVSRFVPTWRSVHRPTRTVGDGYFDRAHHHASFTQAGGADAIERLLRKRKYAVERTKTAPDGTVYLFAERFSWSQYGTFLSHLALLMLLIGALLTRFGGFNETFVIGEGTPAVPVFAQPGPGQLFVQMDKAVRGTDAQGNVIDFHSVVTVRRGNDTVTCKVTVNTPCSAFGYKIHQAAFFNDIAKLKVTDSTGRLIWDDLVDFQSETNAVPTLRVTGPGNQVLFAGDLPQMSTDNSGPLPMARAVLSVPGQAGGSPAVFGAAWRVTNGVLRLTLSSLATGTTIGQPNLTPGDSVHDGDYTISYVQGHAIPAITLLKFPGAASPNTPVTLQMPTDADGNTSLFISGLDAGGFEVAQGQPVISSAGDTYSYNGQVNASGVSVKRDPGSTFIFVAVIMALIGLAITFYIPRRRLWVRVQGARTSLAGVAERTTRFSRELRLMGAELGARDALQEGDLGET